MSYITEAKTNADAFIQHTLAYKASQKDEDLSSAIQAWKRVYQLITDNNPFPHEEDFLIDALEMRRVRQLDDLAGEISRIPPAIRAPVLIIGFLRYMLRETANRRPVDIIRAFTATDEFRQVMGRYLDIVLWEETDA